MPCPEAERQFPILALDVVDNGRSRPCQQRGHNKTNPLAGSGGGKAKRMLRAIMPEIVALVTAEHHAVGTKQASLFDFLALGPAGGAECLDVLRLPRPPDRHEDGDRDGD
jgi:hypothetical protein